MTDAQLGTLLAVLGPLGAALIGVLRWAALRITKALDDNTASNKEDADAKTKLAFEMGRLSSKIDDVALWVEHHTPVHGVPIPRRASERAQTQPGLYSQHRKRTEDER